MGEFAFLYIRYTVDNPLLTIYRDRPHGAHRKHQYDSLFTLNRTESRTCSECNETYRFGTLPDLGFRVRPLTDGTDSIDAAIDRCMTDSLEGVTASCSLQCKKAYLTQE